jgi:hypothetical protein
MLALVLACCSSPPDTAVTRKVDLPLAVGSGAGSQFGNYPAEIEGEHKGASGERCVVFNWDRPLTSTLAVRLKSESCESRGRPGWMLAKEISRTIIPIGQSNLKDGTNGTDQPPP